MLYFLLDSGTKVSLNDIIVKAAGYSLQVSMKNWCLFYSMFTTNISHFCSCYGKSMYWFLKLFLQRVPKVNSHWAEESVQVQSSVDISVAVATDSGLITPIIRNAVNLSISQISTTTKVCLYSGVSVTADSVQRCSYILDT